ncbi:MAG TPA: TonB-dependent receptor [Longimicrobium sp.]|jgi:iron complex outermembrane receptor protein|uniref:TonB-dependent receptor n=1 Tax=Longimicrobium sp. TaxID=2029185 RepID=UPI002ED7FBDB
MRRTPLHTLLFLLALLFAAAPAFAQDTGGVSGTLRDISTGLPLRGATVQAMGPGGQVAGSATTGANGVYTIRNLPAGEYDLVITGPEMAERRVAVQVRAGQTSRVDSQLASSNLRLDPVVVSASKRPEKAVDAPARVEVVSLAEIQARPTTTPADHLRGVAGVDVAPTGLQSSNVVARGFNNIFSGALHALTDNRIAGVPSLRVNFLHFAANNNDDIARMEVVLGPGAALYGPNTANGILHIITRSPLDDQSTSVSVGGGGQGLMQGDFRVSRLVTPNLGFKVSGQFLQADEWEYTDPAETAEQQKFASNLSFYRADLMRASGITQAQADERIARIGDRDFQIRRWGGEARADWRFRPDATAVLSAGSTTSNNGIELTGLGAAQVRDWRYTYYQARTTWGRLFAQAYLNQSDAGDTFLLRNGAPISDRSRLLVGQLQHGASMMAGRQRFTYGADYLLTTPVTAGTINGWYEDRDETREFGGYLQSETDLSPRLELVLAGRVDTHSALPDPVFSPRAALVFKPREGQAFRLSYNRAFSTPSSINQFLDLGSTVPNADLARLGYSLRIQGTGADGFSFRGADGGYQVRSPFTPAALGGPGTLLPATSATLMPLAVGVLAQRAAAGGTPLPAQLVAYLGTLRPTAAQVGLNYLDVASGTTGALSSLTLNDIEPIRESPSTTLEAGYKGLIADRFVLAADLWWSRKESLVTPLTIQTPLLLLNGPQLGAYLVPRLMADLGMSQAQATATAASLVGSATTPGLATIPVGVISSADVDANGGQLLVTYVNVDESIDLWGTDLSAKALVNSHWSLGSTVSFANHDRFNTANAGLVTLNAPRWKGSFSVDYDRPVGAFGQLRMRYSDAFPVNSGVYVGTACAGATGPLVEECVHASTLLDLNLGYRVPSVRGTTLNVAVSNLLDHDYRPFPGVPVMGRMVIARVKYEF